MKFRATYIQDQDRIVFESRSKRPVDISQEVVGDSGSMRYLKYADTDSDEVQAFIFTTLEGKYIASFDENSPIGIFSSYEKAVETILEKL